MTYPTFISYGSGTWGSLSSAMFLMSGIWGDLLLIRFALVMAYAFLIIHAFMGELSN